MKLTKEQTTIVSHVKATTGLTKINAVAGSGKTTLLTAIANTVEQKTSGLYLAYTKSVAVEAQHKFPKWVKCSTTHSLAYQAIFKAYKLHLGDFSYRSITHPVPFETKCNIVEHIESFCLSEFTTFEEYAAINELSSVFTILCNHYLELMAKGKIGCTHTFYLKLYHILLSNGQVSYPNFDLITLDECVSGLSGVKTEVGIVPIRRLYRMQDSNEELPKVKSFNTTTKKFEYQPIIKVFKNGTKQTFKVTTSSKYNLKATARHKLLTQRGYVEVKDLKPYEDYVLSDAISNLRSAKILNEDQLQIVLGSYLGDGYLIQENKQVNCFSLKFTQGKAQLSYLKWKMQAFPSLSTRRIKSGYTGELSIYQTNQVPNFILDSTPFELVISKINDLGLSVWAMDDGTLSKCGRFTLCSNSFSFDQNTELSLMLETRFNVKCSVESNGKGHWQLTFSKKETHKFMNIIEPFLDSVFIDKWGLNIAYPIYLLDSAYKHYTGSYVISVIPHKEEQVYDLSVLNTNNYIITSNVATENSCSTIVHNCGDVNSVTLEIFKLLPATRKVMVGDTFQNIFNFNKTINGFEALKNKGTLLPMTQSFRVSDTIASKIEKFCQKYLDPNMHFKGVPIEDKTINSRLYIARTNASIINKMMELNRLKIPYGLVRKAKQIFNLHLTLISLKRGGFVAAPELKYLQDDVDQFYKDKELQLEYKTHLNYIKEFHSYDQGLVNTIKSIYKYGQATILNTYEEARKHEKLNQTYMLGTSHAVKGLESDYVELADDMNLSILDITEALANKSITLEELTQEQVSELNLYYVAVSRARKELVNASHL